MEHTSKQNIAVGLTTLGGLVALAVMVMLFGYVPQFLQTGYHVQIHFSDAGGLHDGSRAQLSGIQIGKVSGIQLAGGDQKGVIVTVRIDPKYRLPMSTTAQVTNASLLGGSPRVSFTPNPDQPGADRYLATDGSATIQGETGSLVATLGDQLEDVIDKPMHDLERITDSFQKLSDQWAKVGNNLVAMTEPRDPEAVNRGETMANLTTIVARADSRFSQAEQVLSSMQALFGDKEFREDLKQTVGRTRDLTQSLDARLNSLQKRYTAVADDFAKVATSAQTLLDRASDGKGTVAKLLNDPALYENLNDVAQRLQAVIDDARLLIQKWKSEGLPIQF